MSDSIVILGAARTPLGAFQGDFSSLAAHPKKWTRCCSVIA
jgi:acetyl-CoA C-acetyltransferase